MHLKITDKSIDLTPRIATPKSQAETLYAQRIVDIATPLIQERWTHKRIADYLNKAGLPQFTGSRHSRQTVSGLLSRFEVRGTLGRPAKMASELS